MTLTGEEARRLYKTSAAGFTLIELAFVLVIVSLLMGAFLPFIPIWVTHEKTEMTKAHIQEIRRALAQYYARTGSYPCPAARLKMDEAYPFDKDCLVLRGDAHSRREAEKRGVFVANDKDVIEGAVPFRLINVPRDDVFDGWDNLITYAVSLNLTSLKNFTLKGQIAITDGKGESLIDPPDSALWALVSHGEDGSGAYNGNAAADCNPAQLDGKNCDHDGVFVIDELSRSIGKSHYDDFVFYMTWVEAPADLSPAYCLEFE